MSITFRTPQRAAALFRRQIYAGPVIHPEDKARVRVLLNRARTEAPSDGLAAALDAICRRRRS